MKRVSPAVPFVLFFLLVALAISIMGGCGSSSPSSSTTSFFGTQSPGDAWSWTITKDASGSGTFSAADNTTGATYSGTVTTLSNKFLQLGVTASNNQGAVGGTAYAVEFPDTALLVLPAGDSMPVIAAAQGGCPTQGNDYNWIKIPNLTWNHSSDAASGTATTSGTGSTYDFSVNQYLLDGTPDPANPLLLPGATCANGVLSNPNTSNFPVFGVTPSGVMVGDQGTHGGIIGMVQPAAKIGAAAVMQQGREYRGFVYMTYPPNGPDGITPIAKTQPIWANGTGSAITAGKYTNFTAGTEDVCPAGDSCASLVINTESTPGALSGTMTDNHAGSHPFTLMINQINGKYMIFGFSYNDSHDRPYIVLLMEQ